MPWIKTIAPEEASGRLKKIYDEAIKRAGRVFNVVRVQSLNPPVLDASIGFYIAVMFGPSPLSRAQREMLATVTSWANDCLYWLQAHGEDLRAATNDAALAEQIKKDYREAKLDAKTRALCDYAVQLTRDPARSSPQNIGALRRAGASDEEIHDATQVIALFNYYTRLAHALGVEPEDFMPRPPH